MAYTYDPIFAADPNNAANVAGNAAILLFDPADNGKAPITITDVTGSPLPNPITVNRNGFGPAFQHATLDRVGWFGAGFTGYFTSYEGMKAVAVEAAAEATAASATAAAAAEADLAARIAAGEFAGSPGQDGANVLPTQQAIEQAIVSDGPAKNAVIATITDRVGAAVPPLVADAIAADSTVAAAAAGAVTANIAGRDLVEGKDTRVPYISPVKTTHSFGDAYGHPTFLESNATDGGPTPNAVSLIARHLARVKTTPEIDAWGDSMTAGGHGAGDSWPWALSILTGRKVNNYGWSGQRAQEIAMRHGGLTALITVTGGTIPADTSSVAVTVDSPTGVNIFAGGQSGIYTGTFYGIPATLTKDAAGAWTIKRTTAGTATLVPPRTAFIVPNLNRTNLTIIWAARNNTPKDGGFDAVKAMVDSLSPGTEFIVVSVCNKNDEPVGSAGYNDIAALNRRIQDAWPKQYVDLRWQLIKNGLTIQGITPTVDDTAAIAEDRIPPSLLFDDIHINGAGRQVAAKLFASIIKTRGI